MITTTASDDTLTPQEELMMLRAVLAENLEGTFLYQEFYDDDPIEALRQARIFADTLRERIPEEVATIRQSNTRVIITPVVMPSLI